MSTVVVDYGAGNVVSVLQALTRVGADPELSADPRRIAAADRLVFPGQGHFGQAMGRLRQTGLDDVLRDAIAAGRPFIGICLGLQLLFEGSDEAPEVAGLGVLAGRCTRFGDEVKVPQIGWNQVQRARKGTLLDAVDDGQHFYFVHSYHAVCADPGVLAGTAEHGGVFTAAVQRANLFAAQFHPEKSSAAGLALLAAALEGLR